MLNECSLRLKTHENTKHNHCIETKKNTTHIYTWPTMKEKNTHIHMANNERKLKHTYTHGQQ